jgi:3-methyladenine DNA glycosylase AlkD
MQFASQIDIFHSQFQAEGTAERAEAEKAYLKSSLDFYGVSVPVIRQTAKAFQRSHLQLSRANLIGLVKELWQQPYHELRSLGIALLENYVNRLEADDIEVIEDLLRRSQTWAHVDWLATKVANRLVKHYPENKQRLKDWATDDNFWLRRSALLALLNVAKSDPAEFQRFADFAAPMLTETEFFIRKAIGWVLREASKQHPDWVYQFLDEQIDRVSGLTLREGSKYLPSEERDRLLAKHLASN